MVLSSLRVFSLDVGVARVHAHLWAHLEGSGQRIGPYDMIVAATAIAHGYDVFTLNVREFERVPGLIVTRPD